jgi:hypothetical protein
MITENNHRSSSLLKLPGEIRNMIYEFVFATDVDIFYSDIHLKKIEQDPYAYQPLGEPGRRNVQSMGLLVTCRTIYQETGMLMLKKPTFKFDSRWSFKVFHACLTNVQRGTIRHVAFEFCNGIDNIGVIKHIGDPQPRRLFLSDTEVKRHDDRKGQSASEREKQVSKAARKAAKQAGVKERNQDCAGGIERGG